jgi:two-component system chemotaxis sensor kinase CheA
VVLKHGSEGYGLVVDEVLESASLVVKPLHALLRPLGVYGGTTILADGGVALILSADGLARQAHIAERPAPAAAELPSGTGGGGELHTLLLFRSGPAELLALPLSAVQRVVRVGPQAIERVGPRELITVDGQAINILRLEQFLNLSACPQCADLFLIVPRHCTPAIGLLASEIVDTPALELQLDAEACRADGILGCAMIRGQLAVFLDVCRLATMWARSHGHARPALAGPSHRRILVVEDTQFFRHLVASYLQSAGHQVVTAANGRDGLAALAGGEFDLLVSDIEMPEMDGLALAREVRGNARFDALPLLALTSLDSAEDRARILAGGFDAHEVKLDRPRLLETVAALLARGRSGSGLQGVVHG